MANHGSFSGNPKTEWLVDAVAPDRDMELLCDFSLTDPVGTRWPAPKGSVVNGASHPQPLWSSVGSPYTDDYRRASVVQDVACNTSGVPRRAADVMSFHACRAGGCGPVQARILYAEVRIGARAARSLTARSMSREAQLSQITEGLSPESAFMQDKLAQSSRVTEGSRLNPPWRNSMRPSRSTSRSNPSGSDFSPLEHL